MKRNDEDRRDNERKEHILSNITPPSNIIVDPIDVVTVWVQSYEGVPKRDPNGKYNWSQVLSQAVAIAQPGRPSILLPRAGYEQLLVKKRKLASNIDLKKDEKMLLLADNSQYGILYFPYLYTRYKYIYYNTYRTKPIESDNSQDICDAEVEETKAVSK